jgi:DNA replication and repair protein RecF
VFFQRLQQTARRELELGRTLVGPHRDELVFRLGELEVRRYASQGQHQTFGMALKLAQYLYLHARLDESPILLLDDLFGNLDAKRTRVFLEMLQTEAVGQSLITAAQSTPFEKVITFDGARHRAQRIEHGTVQPEPAADPQDT